MTLQDINLQIVNGNVCNLNGDHLGHIYNLREHSHMVLVSMMLNIRFNEKGAMPLKSIIHTPKFNMDLPILTGDGLVRAIKV